MKSIDVGIPLFDPSPSSTLLAPGMNKVFFSVKSIVSTSCRYSIDEPLSYKKMLPFESGQRSTVHKTHFRNLYTNTLTINNVYVRCKSHPDYLLHLRYRCLPAVNPNYPRTGNLWGSWAFHEKGMKYASRIDLWLGPDFTQEEIVELRTLNPNILILTSTNTVESDGSWENVPDDYFLKDINGKKIEVWPGQYRLNLTKPEVASYRAHSAYQRILDKGLLIDGCFFDNVFLEVWLSEDIYGHPVHIDADEDGIEDDPKVLGAAWKAGIIEELGEFRHLMPYALMSGHVSDDEVSKEFFNGDNINFQAAEVLEGIISFTSFWEFYHNRYDNCIRPAILMIESAPHRQISYGYGYEPLGVCPESTWEFAEHYYPYMRFGLALTLMNDGYFTHELGDTYHGNDWWYDELDFDLGHPFGPYQRVPVGITSNKNLVDNGSFENKLGGTWGLEVDAAQGCAAILKRETTGAIVGNACAHIIITNKGKGIDWHIDFHQRNRSLQLDVSYDLSFWVKSDHKRTITISSQKSSPNWRNYGLWKKITIGTQWEKHTVTFKANETVNDARILFFLGENSGDIWFDDIQLTQHSVDVFRRDFENGIVLLNGINKRITIPLETRFKRLQGVQAPRYQYILDDTPDVFSFSGNWQQMTIDSGKWKATGPFYHNWGNHCHKLEGNDGSAEWNLSLRADDTYTIQAWWPASPDAKNWSNCVVYEVMANDVVVASARFDQTMGGDEWHTICTVPLTVKSLPSVRIRNEGTGMCIADALHIFSASRYNDGSDADSVTLEPLDGIILQRR